MVHHTLGALTAFPCNTCSLSFKTSLLQRSHMQSAWHINNLQRKISGQPALSEAEFAECMEQNTNGRRKKSRHEDNSVDTSERLETSSESDGHASETSDYHVHDKDHSGHSSKQTDASLSPTQDSTRCLFCALLSQNTDQNISHMSSAHSFFVPLTSSSTAAVEPLLSYLSLLIYTYHECIYCGREKHSVHGVQSHMRDSAHCKLDISLYEDFFTGREGADKQEEDTTGSTESDEGEKDTTRWSISPDTDSAQSPPSSPRKTRKHKKQHPKSHQPHAQPSSSSSHQQQEEAVADTTTTTTSLQTTTPQNSSLTPSSPSSHVPPLVVPLPPTPSNGRNSALSLAGLSNTQLLSLATLDKKMRRQQVSAQKRVNQLALRQPVKTMYYKTENPVYQAG